MTIPLPAAQTGTGAKLPAAKLQKSGGVWKTAGMGPTFIHDHVIFAKSGPRSAVIPIYTLRKSVAIPPRLGAYHAFNRLQKKAMEKIVDKFITIARGESS